MVALVMIRMIKITTIIITTYIYMSIDQTSQQSRGASFTLLWRHNGRDGVSNQQPHDCLLNRLFRRRSKKTSKLRVSDLCVGNSPVTGEFPAQMASNAENVSIWWRSIASTWFVSAIRIAFKSLAPERWGSKSKNVISVRWNLCRLLLK